MNGDSSERTSNPKGPGEPGSWMDEWCVCKVCGGEIPQGHAQNCDVYEQEKKIERLTRELSTMSTERNQMLEGLESLGWPCRLIELPAHTAQSYREIYRLRAIVAEQQRNCSCPYGDCSTCEKAKAALCGEAGPSPETGEDAHDAQRYRWLRMATAGEWERLNKVRLTRQGVTTMDALIDAAIVNGNVLPVEKASANVDDRCIDGPVRPGGVKNHP